jgi:Domain of unknown function (DUF4157)
MTASRHARAARKTEDEVARQPAAGRDDALGEEVQAGTPAVPNLDTGPLEPEAWLAMQQAIGNSAVGGLVERRRAGQALPADTRHDMEAAFGRDFGEVQIHAGPEVDQAAAGLQAAAFTIGDGIYIPSLLPGFDDPFGKQVLAEELAHVAQGAGAAGLERVTDPGETVEREAQAAGRLAAAGQKTVVNAAPEAAGAVARFGLSDLKRLYESATGGDETANRVERTELSDEEKDRLASGALEPLMMMYGTLAGKSAAGGKIDPKSLQPITDNTAGLSKFIMSFNGPPAVQPMLESAAMSMANGRNALLAALDPTQSVKNVAEGMDSTAAEIEGLATPAPAPAATPDAQPGAAAPEALTTAEAEQLKSGAVEPLRSVAEQLKGEAPDLSIIIMRLHGIPGLLRSFSKPAAIVPQLRKKAMSVEVQAHALQAVSDGAQGAITDAIIEWTMAIGVLSGLTAKSGGGGATSETVNAGDAGDDDNKQKPN